MELLATFGVFSIGVESLLISRHCYSLLSIFVGFNKVNLFK